MNRILLALAFLASTGAAIAQQGNFKADSQINITSFFITATNTAITISNTPATVYSVEIFNQNSATPIWLKLYNSTTARCGVSIPTARYLALSGSNTIVSNVNGDAYGSGIVACLVTGIENSNNTAPSLGQGSVNLHWEAGRP